MTKSKCTPLLRLPWSFFSSSFFHPRVNLKWHCNVNVKETRTLTSFLCYPTTTRLPDRRRTVHRPFLRPLVNKPKSRMRGKIPENRLETMAECIPSRTRVVTRRQKKTIQNNEAEKKMDAKHRQFRVVVYCCSCRVICLN